VVSTKHLKKFLQNVKTCLPKFLKKTLKKESLLNKLENTPGAPLRLVSLELAAI